jgi:hypothetical protein
MKKGGKAIASGGFGCLFKPALKCKKLLNVSESVELDIDNSEKYVSKLMTQKNAFSEYNEIMKIKQLLKNIPNYKNYFLINGFSICEPSPLSSSDLEDFSKCSSLKKKEYTEENINSKISELAILNMPFGGIPVDNFLKTHFTQQFLLLLNKSLIDLLVNGIVPMNNLGIYHCDIKDSNVLVNIDESGIQTRLIDWGLSFEFNENNKNMTNSIYRRPFQYNVPFSIILFSSDFIELYKSFISSLNDAPNYYEIREFVINYIFYWNEKRGAGHLDTINEIFHKLESRNLKQVKKINIKNHIIEYDFTYYYIVEYISNILQKYTIDKTINLLEYFENIFIKNLDIWGFVIIYISFYERIFDYIKNPSISQKRVLNQLKYIFIHFLFEKSIEPINIDNLVIELTKLTTLIENMDTNLKGGKKSYKKYKLISFKKKSLKKKTLKKRN